MLVYPWLLFPFQILRFSTNGFDQCFVDAFFFGLFIGCVWYILLTDCFLSPQARIRGWRTREADLLPSFCLEDLWESFREWSVYGVGVPLLLNGSDSVRQFYVPFLSGIQLYIDPQRLR